MAIFYFLYVHFACPKRTKKAANHLAFGCPALLEKERATSESRRTPPTRLSAFCYAARLRETEFLYADC